MNKSYSDIMVAVLIIAGIIFISSVIVVAGELSFSDKTNAKLAHIKAKARQQEAMLGSGQGLQKNDRFCGSVNVGNVQNSRGSTGTREVTIIITRDIINANNNCM